MDENVKIPMWLLKRTIQLLNCIDITEYELPVRLKYQAVLSAFRKKEQRLALRESYAKIIFAEDEGKRALAKTQYLQEKREICNNKKL